MIPDDVTLTPLTMTAPDRRLPPVRLPPADAGLRDPGLGVLVRQRRAAPLAPGARPRSLERHAHEHELRRARLRRDAGAACSSTSPPRSRARAVAARLRARPHSFRRRPTRRRRLDERVKTARSSRKGTAIALIVGGDLCCSCSAGSCSSRRSARPRRASRPPAGDRGADRAGPRRRCVAADRRRRSRSSRRSGRPTSTSLSKAMPTTTDMPNLLLELTQVVRSSGVAAAPDLADADRSPRPARRRSRCRSPATSTRVTDLLYRLRSLVAVRNGALDVSGRLFSVTSVGLTPSGTGRTLNASIVAQRLHLRRCRSSGGRRCGARPGGHSGPDGHDHDNDASASADTAIGH